MAVFQPTLFKDQVVFITGGSNGGMLIDMARAYLRHGAKGVMLMSRKVDKL